MHAAAGNHGLAAWILLGLYACVSSAAAEALAKFCRHAHGSAMHQCIAAHTNALTSVLWSDQAGLSQCQQAQAADARFQGPILQQSWLLVCEMPTAVSEWLAGLRPVPMSKSILQAHEQEERRWHAGSENAGRAAAALGAQGLPRQLQA